MKLLRREIPDFSLDQPFPEITPPRFAQWKLIAGDGERKHAVHAGAVRRFGHDKVREGACTRAAGPRTTTGFYCLVADAQFDGLVVAKDGAAYPSWRWYRLR